MAPDHVLMSTDKPFQSTVEGENDAIGTPEAKAEDWWHYCPNCGAQLHNQGCKFRCPDCHYFMSCSDFDQ